MSAPPVHCSFDCMMSVGGLQERRHPDNPNTHPLRQIQILAKAIQRTGWRDALVVSRRSGLITRGHGRLDAALYLGLTEVPVDLQDYTDEAEEIADMIADYKIQQLSVFDMVKCVDLVKTRLDAKDLITGVLSFELSAFSVPAVKPPADEGDEDGRFAAACGEEKPKHRPRMQPSFFCPKCGYRSAE